MRSWVLLALLVAGCAGAPGDDAPQPADTPDDEPDWVSYGETAGTFITTQIPPCPPPGLPPTVCAAWRGEFDVPIGHQGLAMRLFLHATEFTDLRVDGPGDCDLNLPAGPDAPAVSLWECPELGTGRHRFDITILVGHAEGELTSSTMGPAP